MDQLNTILESALLGVVQGLTEFLPISSDGHLELAKRLLGFEADLFFTILLHLGTLAAVVLFFRKKIAALVAALFRIVAGKRREGDALLGRLWLLLIVSTAATVPVAIVFGKLNDVVNANPKLIGVCFLVTAAALVLTVFFKARRGFDKLGFPSALVIGALQGTAVLSGVSRSALTVSAGLGAGLDRASAAEYSFLLSIPAIVGAFVFDLRHAAETIVKVSVPGAVAGVLAAFGTGLLAIFLLLRLVKSGRLWLFALYLAPLGALTIIFM